MRLSDPLRLQGAYYLLTGIWPVVHLASFLWLTGPKRDTWLVRTFGVLVAALGAGFLASTSPADRPVARRLAVSSAVAIAVCETWFVARRRIRPVYLLDAAAELGLAAALLGERRPSPQSLRRLVSRNRSGGT